MSALYQNTGMTPGILAVRYTNAGIEDSNGPSVEHFVGLPKEWITIEGEIGPKSGRGIGQVQKPESVVLEGLTLSLADRERFAKWLKLGRFHIWGWIIYRDAFADTPPRLTEFCTRMTGGNGGIGDKFVADITACPEHNCPDRHCRDYAQMMQLMTK